MEYSIYIIKPEAMRHKDQIRQRIIDAGLVIENSNDCILPPKIIDEIYSNLDYGIRKASHQFLGLEECQIGRVVGIDAVVKLLEVSGLHTDPKLCDIASIRFQFGIPLPAQVESALYFKNAIHRPKTQEEARKNLETLGKLFFRTPKTI